jgi:hypothetical protein
MMAEHQIDELIHTGWRVLASDFSETEFRRWRRQAVECLTTLLGADHEDTRRFQQNLGTVENPSDFGTLSPEPVERS